MAKKEAEDQSIGELEQTAEHMAGLAEKGQEEQVLDKDIDELLGWTNALDFDEYVLLSSA